MYITQVEFSITHSFILVLGSKGKLSTLEYKKTFFTLLLDKFFKLPINQFMKFNSENSISSI